MSTIPIDDIVQMNPGVIGAGGTPQLLTGVGVSQDPSIPPNQVLTFFDALDVENWFGAQAPEATLADAYFPGVVNGGQAPYQLQFVGFALTDSPAGSYGAQLGTLTLSQLQQLQGVLQVTTAAQHTSSTINLAPASSFTNAAALMQAAFTSPDFTITYDATRGRFLLLTTATGPSAMCSDVSGSLAASVGLSSASGAFIQSPGVAADTPSSVMNRLVGITRNRAVFTHAYAADITDRLAYAVWNSGQNYKYMYVGWDQDPIDTQTDNAATFGAQVFAAPYQGTLPLYGTVQHAGAVMGYVAAINFNVPNGRSDLAFRQFNAGVPATVSDIATARALRSNNYTYIGAYANAANQWTIAYDGKVSGKFLWVDTYVDQIYLNSELQLAEFLAMLAYGSLPYNSDGYTALYRAGADVATAAVESGIIRQNVTLSQTEIQQVNAAAGRDISSNLQTDGWYFLVTDPANPAQTRTTRGSPTMIFFYTDGGSIQQLNIGSNAVI